MRLSSSKRVLLQGLFATAMLAGCATTPSHTQEELAIWPDGPPDFTPAPAAETISQQSHGWRQISIIKNVSIPTLTIIRPPAERANGAAMIVLPGGAFGALAWDLEGIEVGQFLAERGVTAFVLKYRVHDASPETLAAWQREPTLPNMMRLLEPARARAASDGLQAVRFVREHARRFGIERSRVGMMGFSAGALTTLRVVDEADDRSRPNIVAPIYGVDPDADVPSIAPPLFTAIARDDGLFATDAVIAMRDRWLAAGAPAEAVVFDTGGHGFGLGRPDTDSARFPSLFEAWLREREFITA